MTISPVAPGRSAAGPSSNSGSTGGQSGGSSDGADLFSGLLGAPAHAPVSAPARRQHGGARDARPVDGQRDADRGSDGARGPHADEVGVRSGPAIEAPVDSTSDVGVDGAGDVGVDVGVDIGASDRAAADGSGGDELAQVDTDPADRDTVSTAQILTAAQVVPVASMLAAAPTLSSLDGSASTDPATAGVTGSARALRGGKLFALPALQLGLATAALHRFAGPSAPTAQLQAGSGAPGLVDGAGDAAEGLVPLGSLPTADAATPGATALLSTDAGIVGTNDVAAGAAPSSLPATDAATSTSTSTGTAGSADATETSASADALAQTVAGTAGVLSAGQGDAEHDSARNHKQPLADAVSPTTLSTPIGTVTGAPAMAATDVKGDQAPNAVAGQVFPEVMRLISRGDGTHRITLKINPEALGEVRVVLTVRQGEVQVRLSGGEQAQRALLHGAPELHRLLESVGAGSSQVHVGDHSSTTHHQQGQHGGQDLLGSQDGRKQETGHGHTNFRTAGTRDGDTSARDGAARGAHQRSATDPGTRTRIAGVDVTM